MEISSSTVGRATTANFSVTRQPAECTSVSFEPPYPGWASVLILCVIAIVIIITLFGNLLVILSVCLDRRLRKPPNILIVNLAISDIAVAILDMPLAAAYEIKGEWIWGSFLCDMWVSCDVLACTASIVTLCMISVDRYMAITRPMTYVNQRTMRLMAIFVLIVWVTSAFIGLQPLFLWGGNEYEDNTCLISQNPYFTVVSTVGAFYFPLSVMLLVYSQIYRAARKSELADMKLHLTTRLNCSKENSPGDFTSNCRRGSVATEGKNHIAATSQERRPSYARLVEAIRGSRLQTARKRRISLKRERKAAKTLGVIMGAFIFCWLPFFILALIRPYCNCEVHPLLSSFMLWLGFLNSLLNPIIYPLFNKEFRPAYRRMLSCCLCKLAGSGAGDYHYNWRHGTFRLASLPVNNHTDEVNSSDEEHQFGADICQTKKRTEIDTVRENVSQPAGRK